MFSDDLAADPALDYTEWINLAGTRRVEVWCDLRDYAPDHQLSLFVHTRCESLNARVLVYSYAEQLEDWTLNNGTNNFLITVDSLESPFNLFFIQTRLPDGVRGGTWYSKGVTGYLI